MSFKIRTTKPERGNKFYNNSSNGGVSWCITGYPKDSGCNVLANCVGYACGRFNEIIGEMKYPTLCCNAENFIERAKTAGLEVGWEPRPGGIMVWQKGKTLNGSDGAGHVAVAEKVYNANRVLTSESGYGGSAFWNAERTNNNGRWGMGEGYTYLGCIYNPSVKEDEIPIEDNTSDKLIVDGLWGPATTRRAQEVFGTPKDGIVSNQYLAYRKNNPGLLDSSFEWEQVPGREGSALIRAIQKKVGVRQDGFIGPETIRAMQSWLGTPADGRVDNPSAMVKAFQSWLNEQ